MLEARSLLPTPPRQLHQPPHPPSPVLPLLRPAHCSAGRWASSTWGTGGIFIPKYKELLSPRASLVPSLWVLRKISGGNSSVHPHLSPETPAGHTLPLRSHSRSHSHSLTLLQTHTLLPPHVSPGDAEGPVALQFLCTWGREGRGYLPWRSGPPSPDLRASCPTCQGPWLPAKEASQGSWGLGVGVRRKRGSGENSLSPSLLQLSRK